MTAAARSQQPEAMPELAAADVIGAEFGHEDRIEADHCLPVSSRVPRVPVLEGAREIPAHRSKKQEMGQACPENPAKHRQHAKRKIGSQHMFARAWSPSLDRSVNGCRPAGDKDTDIKRFHCVLQ